MTKALFSTLLLGVLVLFTAPATAQPSGEMFFSYGCDAFELVEDLGSTLDERWEQGRWRVRDLSDGSEQVIVRESLDQQLFPQPDLAFTITRIETWRFEESGIEGITRTKVTGVTDLSTAVVTALFEGELIRGSHHTTGMISGLYIIDPQDPTPLRYHKVHLVLCEDASLGPRPQR